MTWVDAAAIGVVVLSALFSMVRGFVREVLAIFAWVGAGLAAFRLFPIAQPYVASILPQKNLVVIASMGIVFLITLIVLSVISAALSGFVRSSALSQLDRSLGLVFGVARGLAIVCVAYIGLSIGLPRPAWPPPVVNARFLPVAYQGAVWIANFLPPEYRPDISAPDAPAAPPADQLMQPPVAGKAL